MPKILVVDDIKENLEIQSAILNRFIPDCEVITAQSGEKGIELAIEQLPDTILLDIMMPGIDGYETCRRLKKQALTQSIPIIMLTGVHMNAKERVKGLNAGADAFLTKPVESIELVAQVNVMLRIKRAEDMLRSENYQLEAIVKKRTRALQTLIHCNRALVHCDGELYFIQDICKILIDKGSYQFAWVGFAESGSSDILPVAWYNCKSFDAGNDFLDNDLVMMPARQAVKTCSPVILQDIGHDSDHGFIQKYALEKGFRSTISLPLEINNHCVGTLNIFSEEPSVFIDSEAKLLFELAKDLAHGIHTFRIQVEREAAEIAMRNSEEQYRGLFNGVPVGIYRVSPEGLITDANPMLLQILGFPDRDAAMHINFNKKFLSSRDRKRLYTEVNATGYARDFEMNIRNNDNKHIWVALNLKAVYGKNDEILYIEGTVEDISHRKLAEKYIHSLTQELIKAQEKERQRIARDLHDHVAQNLGALKITCDNFFVQAKKLPVHVKKQIAMFSSVLAESIQSVREIAYDLRPPSLDQAGLITTIARYCEDFSETNDIDVDFFSAGMETLKLDQQIEINFYRLIQEALNNIKKHSGADKVIVRLVVSHPQIILRIEDNGKGFSVEERMCEALNEKRMGLKSMEERASLLHGKMKIISSPGHGTRITVKVSNKQYVSDPTESRKDTNNKEEITA